MGCGGQTGPATFSCSLYRVPSAPASGRGLCQSRLPRGHALAVVPNLLPEQLTSHPLSRPARPYRDPSAVSWVSFSPRPPDHLPVQPHLGLCRPPRLPLRSTSQAPQGVRCLCYAGGVSCPSPAGAPSTPGRPPRPYPRPCISFRTFFSARNCGHKAPQLHSCSLLPLPTPLTGVPLQVLGVKAKLGCRREASCTAASSWK